MTNNDEQAAGAISDPRPTDWQDALMRILQCFEEHEGTLYDQYWHEYGIGGQERAGTLEQRSEWREREEIRKCTSGQDDE